jgi:IPT/TIG domain
VSRSAHDEVDERRRSVGRQPQRRLLGAAASVLALCAIAPAQAAAFSWRDVSSQAASPLTASTAPTVAALEPDEGPLFGGERVMIKGTHLTGATAVDFGSVSASFKAKTSAEIEATAPPGEGTVDVTVTTPDGTSALSPGDQFHYVPTTPEVEEVSPGSGSEMVEESVLIKGRGFTGATAVDFGATSAVSFTVRSSTRIIANDPHGTGTVNVTVTTPESTSPATPADEFTYTGIPPEVATLSPRKVAAAGGTTVSIGGRFLLNASAVEFGTVPGTILSTSTEGITAVVPPETVGQVSITVTTPYGVNGSHRCGHGESCPVLLEYADPTITEVSPDSGPAGTVVTVTGSGFGVGSGESKFVFGTALATSESCASSMRCTVVTPAHANGTVRVKETAVGTSKTTPASPAAQFTYD